MGEKRPQEPVAKKMAPIIDGAVRKRLRRYLADNEQLTQKRVFNEALDEYLKKRGA